MIRIEDKKISDLQRRLDAQYDRIDEVEETMTELKSQIEYSCAMKSHFRKFGNQMSGSGNHLCNYASLLA